MSDLTAKLRRMANRLDRKQAADDSKAIRHAAKLIESLPKTVDGEPLATGEIVWMMVCEFGKVADLDLRADANQVQVVVDGNSQTHSLNDVYSTLHACKAALVDDANWRAEVTHRLTGKDEPISRDRCLSLIEGIEEERRA